jgi:hypothetical protein
MATETHNRQIPVVMTFSNRIEVQKYPNLLNQRKPVITFDSRRFRRNS